LDGVLEQGIGPVYGAKTARIWHKTIGGLGVVVERTGITPIPVEAMRPTQLERVPIWRNRFGIHNVWLL
jgi:hypothetical protein